MASEECQGRCQFERFGSSIGSSLFPIALFCWCKGKEYDRKTFVKQESNFQSLLFVLEGMVL